MGTTITMDQSEYDALQKQIIEARNDAAKARDELLEERRKPVDERVAALTEFNVAAKEIIDYAVANLSPEFSRGWPAEAMDVVAKGVTTFGAVTSRDHERSVIWRQFADSVRDFDRRWALAMMSLGGAQPNAAEPPPHTIKSPVPSADADVDGVSMEISNKHLAWFGLAFIAFLAIVVGAMSLQQ